MGFEKFWIIKVLLAAPKLKRYFQDHIFFKTIFLFTYLLLFNKKSRYLSNRIIIYQKKIIKYAFVNSTNQRGSSSNKTWGTQGGGGGSGGSGRGEGGRGGNGRGSHHSIGGRGSQGGGGMAQMGGNGGRGQHKSSKEKR